MNASLKNILKYIVFLTLGGLLFFLAFRNTDFQTLISDFRRANYFYVIISIIIGYLAFMSRGMRWVLLLEPLGQKPNTWNAIHAVTVGYLTNLVLPRAGEVARCTALNQSDKIPVNRLLGTVILERVIDFIMLLSLLVLTLILQLDNIQSFLSSAFANEDPAATGSSDHTIKIIIAVFLGAVFLLLYLLRHKFMHLPFYQKIRDFWDGIKEGLRSLSKLESKIPFILHTLFIWFTYYFIVYISFFALEATSHLGFSDALFIMIVAGFGMVVPTPGGIGAYHYLVMLGMVVLGLSSSDGVSFGTLVHSSQLIMTVISGLLALALLFRKRKNNKIVPPVKEAEEA